MQPEKNLFLERNQLFAPAATSGSAGSWTLAALATLKLPTSTVYGSSPKAWIAAAYSSPTCTSSLLATIVLGAIKRRTLYGICPPLRLLRESVPD